MFYAVFHLIFFIIAKVFFRVKVIGHSNIPKKGGVIIASNHVSYLDPPFVGCVISRRVNYMARDDLFRNPVFAWILRKWKAFPVKRGTGDSGAIKEAVRRLKKGEPMLLFPEGTRSRDGRLREGKAGVGMIVALSGAKVVPAYIKGSEEVLPRDSKRLRFKKVIVSFGKPIDFTGMIEENRGNKDLYSDISKRIMEGIAELKEELL
ncbi:MAG: 1-acyl-sn-glycerol-3-phosphate acyltransferase [Nitrospirae bacterium]|nr:1-acyl-sn-glycerol-3-phosphate acyltransferase [Nitrospirota bacterium]